MSVLPQRSRGLAVLLLLFLAAPAGLGAQLGAGVGAGGMLDPTTGSSSAKAAVFAGFDAIHNARFSRGVEEFRRALSDDPDLGLARVLAATVAIDLTDEGRKAEMDRGVQDAARSSPAEALLALAWRQWAAGDAVRALPLMRAARDFLPNDPGVAFTVAELSGAVNGRSEGIRAQREVIAAFPNFAPAHNILAYQLWDDGDHAGAFAEVRRYVELAPENPNSYDSYAELLQFDGQYEAAIGKYQASLKADSAYLEADVGLAEVYQLQGRGDRARVVLGQAVAGATSSEMRLPYLRELAGSYLYDGNIGSARNQLANVASQANKVGQIEVAARTHRELALIDGAFGDGRGVAAHLAEGGEGATRGELAGIAYALSRQSDAARAVAADLLASSDSAAVRSGHLVQALIAWKSGNVALAGTELAMAPPDAPITRAVSSQVERRSGNSFAANSIRDQLANNPRLDFGNITEIVARRLAAGQ